MVLSQLASNITPSATLSIDARAKELLRTGIPVINFGVGEPDFETPPYVLEAVSKAIYDPANHKYSPARGLAELRSIVANDASMEHQAEFSAENVTVCNGAKQALHVSLLALLDAGDEVLLPAPYWTSYPELIRIANGQTRVVSCAKNPALKPTVEALERHTSSRTKVFMLCSPSNPTGAVLTKAELEDIGRWCHAKGIWLLMDEVYSRLMFDGSTRAPSVLEAAPELGDRVVIVSGVSKTYAMTGWRVGWTIGS